MLAVVCKVSVYADVQNEIAKEIDLSKIKHITSTTKQFTNISTLIRLAEWVARYNMAPTGSILKMCLPLPFKQVEKLIKDIDSKNNDHNPTTLVQPKEDRNNHTQFSLKDDQAAIASAIMSKSKEYNTSVIHGVTGSGKTEVFLWIAQNILNQGKQVLILLPEIVLTTQLLQRFKNKLHPSVRIAQWHSGLSLAERRKTWYSIINGEVDLVVGARSALFLPFNRLALIIVDEEHDTSFKQEEKVIYNARDISLVRGKIENIPVLLSSATPSIETMLNVKNKKFDYYQLKKRYSGVAMPEIQLVDISKMMLEDKASRRRARWISDDAHNLLLHTWNNKKQSMIFINRRGYAPIVFCAKCGEKASCPSCKLSLAYHKQNNSIQCHYCNHSIKFTDICPSCNEEGGLIYYGPGVERIAEEVSSLLPDARIAIITSDTINSIKKAQEMIQLITEGKIDIIIGTQIIAKGLHFPALHSVLVIDADPSTLGADIRAIERTHQLLYQVLGRAGRENIRGKVILQSHNPQHPLFSYLLHNDMDNFFDLELKNREESNMPPFRRLAVIHFSAYNQIKILQYLDTLRLKIPQSTMDIAILGPAESPLSIINKQFRYRIVINANKKVVIQNIVRSIINSVKIPSYVKVKIDIDPQNFH